TFLCVIELDERLYDMLPIAVDWTGTLIIRVDGVGDGCVIDRDSVIGSRKDIAVNDAPYHSAHAKRDALLQKIPAPNVDFCLIHSILLRKEKTARAKTQRAPGKTNLFFVGRLDASHSIDS